MVQDETMGPTFEDFMLYTVIGKIDSRLLDYVHKHYQLKCQGGHLCQHTTVHTRAGWKAGFY